MKTACPMQVALRGKTVFLLESAKNSNSQVS